MLDFIYTSFNFQYYTCKIPTWYRKLVCNIKIPENTLDKIKRELKNNQLNKQGIKQLLLKIQKENARKNKTLWNFYLEETLPNRYDSLHLNIVKKSNLTAVIVEARKHPHFKVVVQNVISNLQHLNVCLHIYHGSENEIFIKESLKEYKNIKYINLNVINLDIEGYNKIMLSKHFWSNFKSDKILIFQTDAITFKPLDEKFLLYDYIGAPWKKHIRKKNKVNVGNGGLSIRSKKMMLAIIEQDIPRKKNMPEDVYICQIIKKQKYNLAIFNKAFDFATENVINTNAFGCHKIWEETTVEQLEKILK
ncbi:DUF5672 family protein [Flavicella sp.]|uniref:DUF5672 family protein n=1 Tax=Flavicella sp. TaxID=2957742 RepID=UPI00301A5571